MRDLIHGGDIYSYNSDILDFSANINPFGMPNSVKEAIINSIDKSVHYPDPVCKNLISEIGKKENLPDENIICGNGAADIIYRIVYGLKPKKALILAPTFAEYEQSLKSINCEIIYHNLYDDFVLDEGIINKIKDVDMVFICNPNNPTGVLTNKELLEKILFECEKHDAMLVLDECFNEFLENPDDFTLKEYINKSKNLIIIKAFTKIYAMAGIRLGYGLVSNKTYIEILYKAGATWNVSVIAQEAGIAALKEDDYVEKTRELIIKERSYLTRELKELGFRVYNSMANYIFFNCDLTNLKEELIKYNILIRDCSNYIGLSKGFYRIAVKLPEENKYFIESIRRLYGKRFCCEKW